MKTNKSYTKRLRVTRNGKIVARKGGQDHFNSRDSRKTRTVKARAKAVEMSPAMRARFLPGNGK
ncbi:50S ribosomal protein L35 [Patescibacteria group bacterium]|jgi:ribosomal protein L35|nr:50S ribosomal protein L35 [Candidatus Paceibacterota bacterium]TAK58768.1 MAG: 50S ribosomal protein L35 [Patescibacteria group bacterium]